ncbi:MAG: amino acid-binding protein [Candidatus Muproteobacteria bacterium RIFCSPHIGHO2_02_FULL_65_16]|uniref:Amino acid-binding protein n=1 Tax=Candidatus Muproteobacteria bacterium RIFCSPHIGHO2_02_FULL_65_16 TaxID=1817766 RepID=A0A1F6TYW9_9PROT|nr:MAG: amino acid-binding protein [Candidatus Muproteobacteria bacterium RIFCSPHIGHO2_02_FULL_65_16]
MKRWHMLTVVGRDQPGIVAALTETLYRGGANLGEASMVRLGGNFTIMLMVEADADEPGLRRLLEPVTRRLQLHAHIDAIEGRLHEHVEPNVRVVVHGADRPGIVAQVTAALAANGLNILDLESDVGGTADRPIYIMTIDGYTRDGIAALERALEPLRRTGIEARLTPIDTMVG